MSLFGNIGCKGLRGRLGPVGDPFFDKCDEGDGPFRKPQPVRNLLLDDPDLSVAKI